MAPESTDAELTDLARRAHVADAVRDRHRSAAVEARRREHATIVDVLLGAVDRRVVLHMCAGPGQIAGEVTAVGVDLVEIRADRQLWWVTLSAITAVGASSLSAGDLADRSAVQLADLLTDLVDTDRPVAVVLRGGTTLHGTVESVGAALWLRTEHPVGTQVVELDHLLAVSTANVSAAN
jgi:hypothetical protein